MSFQAPDPTSISSRNSTINLPLNQQTSKYEKIVRENVQTIHENIRHLGQEVGRLSLHVVSQRILRRLMCLLKDTSNLIDETENVLKRWEVEIVGSPSNTWNRKMKFSLDKLSKHLQLQIKQYQSLQTTVDNVARELMDSETSSTRDGRFGVDHGSVHRDTRNSGADFGDDLQREVTNGKVDFLSNLESPNLLEASPRGFKEFPQSSSKNTGSHCSGTAESEQEAVSGDLLVGGISPRRTLSSLPPTPRGLASPHAMGPPRLLEKSTNSSVVYGRGPRDEESSIERETSSDQCRYRKESTKRRSTDNRNESELSDRNEIALAGATRSYHGSENGEDDDFGDEDEGLLKQDKLSKTARTHETSIQINIAKERDQGIQRITSQIAQANSIFRELANLVVSQNEPIETLESNMDMTVHHARAAKGELEKAAKYQRRSRARFCFIAAAAVFAFIFFFIISLPSKETTSAQHLTSHSRRKPN